MQRIRTIVVEASWNQASLLFSLDLLSNGLHLTVSDLTL